MPRFRRYRVFLVFAVIITLLVLRTSKGKGWGTTLSTRPEDSKTVQYWEPDEDARSPQLDDSPAPAATAKQPAVAFEEIHESLALQQPSSAPVADLPLSAPAPVFVPPTPTTSALLRAPEALVASTDVPLEVVIPDRKPILPSVQSDDDEPDELHADHPGNVEASDLPAPTPIHWRKQPERFPVPSESLIKLPTGRPLPIPKIQYAFSGETADEKMVREGRQARVKGVFEFAWNGYKEKAWLHDEVKPVSGTFKDPFCGWAATLVDALDSLWIMGLETEFANAVEAIGQIDFTISLRKDIPVFETTIRYLGGLLAAYDVSGGKHTILLDKAVELAEILMGAFDTPNRMPYLFYKWKPAFASQPHRASTRANLAELGSLSMEFTRLAQLTHENKYYDAVARVTNALEEWQNRGTAINGAFPDVIDASGCNRTASSIIRAAPGSKIQDSLPSGDDPKGYEAPTPVPIKEPEKDGKRLNNPDIDFVITPGEPGKARIQEVGQLGRQPAKRAIEELQTSNITARQEASAGEDDTSSSAGSLGPTNTRDWDCLPQGLEAPPGGRGAYHVGGGADSTYEYFPKQYLLLGGLEGKYRTMYLKLMAAVREHFLFRPMLPDNRDVLFSGKVTTHGHPDDPDDYKFDAEVTHLTCFVGGMVGMGAKIFDIPLDIEIGEKLSDGCVWAYESTKSGLMPEYAIAIPCESVKDCEWNQELWYNYLDPIGPQRAKMIEDYESRKAVAAAQVEAERNTAAATAEEVVINGENEEEASSVNERQVTGDEDERKIYARAGPIRKIGGSVQGQKQNAKDFGEKLQKTVDELNEFSNEDGGKPPPPREPQLPASEEFKSGEPDPYRPKTHEEFVESRLRSENIPQGFASINSNKYILR